MAIISGNMKEPAKRATVNITRHEYFIKRLRELGLYDRDSDYEGMIGTSVEELSFCFKKQGHSGASAEMTLKLFNMLMDEWGNPAIVKEQPTMVKKVDVE